MFGIGFFEILIIIFIILIFIKPQDLPSFIRRIGKIYSQVRNGYNSFLRMLNSYQDEMKDMVQLNLEEENDEKPSPKKISKITKKTTKTTKKQVGKQVKKKSQNLKNKGKVK